MSNLVHADSRQLDQPKKRRTWLEKHGELISKLQNDFQLPEVVESSTTTTRFHTFTIGSLNFLISNTLSPEILEETSIYTNQKKMSLVLESDQITSFSLLGYQKMLLRDTSFFQLKATLR